MHNELFIFLTRINLAVMTSGTLNVIISIEAAKVVLCISQVASQISNPVTLNNAAAVIMGIRYARTKQLYNGQPNKLV